MTSRSFFAANYGGSFVLPPVSWTQFTVGKYVKHDEHAITLAPKPQESGTWRRTLNMNKKKFDKVPKLSSNFSTLVWDNIVL